MSQDELKEVNLLNIEYFGKTTKQVMVPRLSDIDRHIQDLRKERSPAKQIKIAQEFKRKHTGKQWTEQHTEIVMAVYQGIDKIAYSMRGYGPDHWNTIINNVANNSKEYPFIKPEYLLLDKKIKATLWRGKSSIKQIQTCTICLFSKKDF